MAADEDIAPQNARFIPLGTPLCPAGKWVRGLPQFFKKFRLSRDIHASDNQ